MKYLLWATLVLLAASCIATQRDLAELQVWILSEFAGHPQAGGVAAAVGTKAAELGDRGESATVFGLSLLELLFGGGTIGAAAMAGRAALKARRAAKA